MTGEHPSWDGHGHVCERRGRDWGFCMARLRELEAGFVVGNMDKSGRQDRLDARYVEEACGIRRTAAAAAGWRPEIERQWVCMSFYGVCRCEDGMPQGAPSLY